MAFLRVIAETISALNNFIGKALRYLIIPMMVLICLEVFMRYLVHRPTSWATETSGMLFGVYVLMGGAYGIIHRSHVNVDILHSRFSPRARAAIDIVTYSLFYIFCGVLLLKGIEYAQESVLLNERSNSVWAPYVWPAKLFIPIGAFLILLQGLVKTTDDMVLLLTGKPLLKKVEEESDLPETMI